MGFTPEPTHYKLAFEDPSLAGLEVTVAGLSVGDFLALTEMAALADPSDPASAAKAASSAGDMLSTFGAALVGWNVDGANGQPLPATYDGVKQLEFGFVFRLVTAWISAMADVSPNLPGGLNSPVTSPEESLALASSSQSLTS